MAPNKVVSYKLCEHCGITGSGSTELKKCGRCSVTLYCSRECQTAAWPLHKRVCRGLQAENSSSHSGSLSSHDPQSPGQVMGSELEEFERMHYWAIRYITRALVHFLPGGVEAAMSPTNPMFMRLVVAPTKAAQPNSANSWFIVEYSLVSLSVLLSNYPELAEHQAIRQERGKEVLGESPNYLGFLPVVYMFMDNNSLVLSGQPMYRLRDPELVRRQSTHDALHDFIRLCENYTNNGFPLQEVDPSQPPYVLPGRLVRKKNTTLWRWAPLFEDWEGQRAFPEEYTPKTTMSPPQLIKFVTSL